MTDEWKWPDSRFERRTHVARMYRARLAEVDAAACAELDEIMNVLGQRWAYDGNNSYDDYDLLTLDEAAEWADVSRNAVQKWIARGHIERRLNADKQVSILMKDLLEYRDRRDTRAS